MNELIKIIRQPYEEPYHINLIFKATNGDYTGTLEIYENAEYLKKLADVLEDFPFNGINNFLWERGSENPEDRFAYYFKCDFALKNKSGDCIIKIRLNNNDFDDNKSIAEFNIECYPADLNRLGKLFREFSILKKETLIWYGTDGIVK